MKRNIECVLAGQNQAREGTPFQSGGLMTLQEGTFQSCALEQVARGRQAEPAAELQGFDPEKIACLSSDSA